jgi:hypothetical protein
MGPGPVLPWAFDEHLVARNDVGEQPAEHPLALALHVDVRRVDERPAGLVERDQLRRGVVLVGVTAPRHRAESKAGDDEAAAAQVPVLHRPEVTFTECDSV